VKGKKLDYNDYIEIADGIYWVGFVDNKAGFHCNPYLITDNNEAVLIDGGSRDEFSTVMLKIIRTGTNPRNITRLIYQHYDPDLCGNVPHLEAVIGSRELKIISHCENNIFINYYSAKSPKQCIEGLGFHFEFSSGRRLEFIRTPYCHTSGSFITYDTKTKVLFSSDIFGGYGSNWSMYSQISKRCENCSSSNVCPATGKKCQITGILRFHKHIMPSKKALHYALSRVEGIDISLIAPQHGSILHTPVSQKVVIERLKSLTSVGIDHFLEENGI